MASVKITKAPKKLAHDIKTFTITLEQNNGLDPVVKTCMEGESIELPTPITPSGLRFKGWSFVNDELAEVLPGTSYTPHKSVTLYAIYKAPITAVVYWKVDESVNTLHLSAEYKSDYNSWSIADAIPPWTSGYGQAQITDPSGVMFDTVIAPQYCSYWFCNMPHLSTFSKFENLRMYYCESISNMFHYCAILPNLDLSGWQTVLLKNMNSAFTRCKRFTALDLSVLDLSKVETMENLCLADAELQSVTFGPTESLKIVSGLFNNCPKLASIDLSPMAATNITAMSSTFRDCPALKVVKLTNWNTYKVANMNSMFNGDSALEHIYVSDSWTTDAVVASSDMFKNCVKLPNFDSTKLDKTHAKIGEYLEKGD